MKPTAMQINDKPIQYFLFFWSPVIVYCVVIFIQSAFPTSNMIPETPHIDKVLHCLGYALLGVLFIRAYRSLSLKHITQAIILYSIASTILYGISDEFHQYFVPSRTADVWDVLADSVGACLGVWGYHFTVRDKRRIPQP